jgi:hypothetical protein
MRRLVWRVGGGTLLHGPVMHGTNIAAAQGVHRERFEFIQPGDCMAFSSKQACAVLLLAACGAAAGADEKTFDFSGFGTAGVAWSDTDKGELVRDIQPRGVDSTGDVGIDSLVGVQGTVHWSSAISATAQVMFRRSTSSSFTLDVPLAFVKDQLTQDLAVRVGRLQLPAFMISEYRQVGYANTFIRPPLEVYGQVPLDYIDGVDGLYSHSFGPVDVNLGAFYGRADLSVGTIGVSVRKSRGGNLSATWGPLTLRYGRVESFLTLTTPADALIDAVRTTGFTALADQLSANNKAAIFTGYGLSADWHNVLVQGEYTQSAVGGYLADSRGRYGLVGYRIHRFTPFVSYAQRNPISPQTDGTIPPVGPLLPLALGVNALLTAYRQHTTSFGIRWDFHDSMDLKLQVDRISPQGPGLFVNVQPGFKGPVTVAAVALDFVF